MTPANYNTWLRDTAAVALDDGVLTVAAPSDFCREWLQTRLRDSIVCTLCQLTESSIDVRFTVLGSRARPAAAAPAPANGSAAADRPDPAPAFPLPCASPRLTFETFIAGDENILAYNGAVEVAARTTSPYNPLVLHGPPGVGKTHLLHAIANAAGAVRRTILATTEKFVNDYVRASMDRTFDRFRERYRTCELLIMDDFQYLEGKQKSEEEFYHTFNALHDAGAQIVLALDRPPVLLALAERLRSRLHLGLVADVHAPTAQTRLEIVARLAAAGGQDLPDDVLALLASQPAASVRDVHGIYNRLAAFLAIHRGPLTLEVAARAISPFAPPPHSAAPTAAVVLNAVCEYFGVRPDELSGPGRGRHVTYARHVAMYLMKTDHGRPVTDIGRLLGGRDHSTVLHGCEKITREIRTLPQTREDVEALRRRLAAPAA